ncbi:MAG: excinuclease ABC subunit UvrB [Bdellovibrionales bacterium]|nr:excinuclease ABC subunit UvrB [Bdellovibrionales bacterium]
MRFQLKTNYSVAGDQPEAIHTIYENLKTGEKHQTLLGVTGSGKTFTMANVIQKMQKPTLVLAPNKTLAAQLFSEFRELFPKNAVEYFVSYYDYYQPEAYLPSTDTYIEKDSSINDQIDRMRHSATMALLERKDVIIVSSVSCIYGLGSPDSYKDLMVHLYINQNIKRDTLLRALVEMQYQRKDFDFHRGTFRVRGDRVEVFPAYEEDTAFRIEFFGDYIDFIGLVDPIQGQVLKELHYVSIYPGSHYVSTKEANKKAIKSIKEELKQHLQLLANKNKKLEYDRLKRRTLYDLEIIKEMGTCPGIENYSRHFTGRAPGEPPPTLLEYFPKSYLLFIDESHISVPQVGGMYRGDRSRKETLVQHGFRLPSALDNRPLNFQEFEKSINQVVYVSATPGDYEMKQSRGEVIEQIIRPTGLLDPEVFVCPTLNQVSDLLKEIKKREKKKERVLVVTLTKKMAESLAAHYQSKGVQIKYLHSDIKTIERMELIRDLRMGVFQVLVGINLLREGLDLPEVSLVAVMDADKEGFLRSRRSLIQIIGRAARHINGQVILYADTETKSMSLAIEETKRRRHLQHNFNQKHKIKIRSVRKPAPKGLMEIYGFEDDLQEEILTKKKFQKGKSLKEITHLRKEISLLKKEMKKASEKLDFERAVKLRDKIKRLQIKEMSFS